MLLIPVVLLVLLALLALLALLVLLVPWLFLDPGTRRGVPVTWRTTTTHKHHNDETI